MVKRLINAPITPSQELRNTDRRYAETSTKAGVGLVPLRCGNWNTGKINAYYRFIQCIED